MRSTRRALTITLAATLAGTLSAPAFATSSADDPAPEQIKVLCDGIGEDTITVTGDEASIEDGPLQVVGEPGFVGRDASGATVEVPATGEGAQCEALEPTKGDDLEEVLPTDETRALPKTTGAVSGKQTFTVVVTEPAPAAPEASTAPQAAAATKPLPFSSVSSYLRGRSGAVGVAVRVPGSGTTYTYTKTRARNYTASIVKVQIMAAVMLRAQDAGRGLTAWEKSQIVPMIRQSDNAATTRLFNDLGGRSAITRSAARLKMTATVADPGGRWGLTSTTPADQVILMEHFARSTGLLNSTNRAYGLSEMRKVASSQRWGVTAGPPSGSTAVKNGWLPRTTGWHVNSIGFTKSGSSQYTIAVLTNDNPGSMSTQISTIEGVSRRVWANRSKLKPSLPARGVRGDMDRDKRADVRYLTPGGRLVWWKANSSGALGTRKVMATGLTGVTWIGDAGDVNRDGRSDILMRRSNGTVELRFTTSTGTLGPAKRIITGWGPVTDIASGVDIDRNGRLDIVTRRPGGYARHYELSDSGSLRTVRDMGRPFAKQSRIIGVRDVNGDGRDDVRALNRETGALTTFTSTGTAWRSGTTVAGFGGRKYVSSPGDLAGTNRQDDVLALSASGNTIVRWLGLTGGGLGYRSVRPESGSGIRVLF